MVQIRQLIAELFTVEEMNTLMFDLDIDHDEIHGQTRAERARELAAYCERRGLVDALIHLCQESRPHAPWPVL